MHTARPRRRRGGRPHLGRRAGFDKVLTFDMGAISTDVSLCPGRPLRTREFDIDGQPVAIPGPSTSTPWGRAADPARASIAGGALRVARRARGPTPAPSAGRGGTQITVTDAHVWLGRLPVDAFGGQGHLDRAP